MKLHYQCIYCRQTFIHSISARERHLLTIHLNQITSETGFQVKRRFPNASSILLEKEYTEVTRRFSSQNQVNLLGKVINFFSHLHSQVKCEIKLSSCWVGVEGGDIEKLWFSLPNFSWRGGEAGVNNFLHRAFRDFFIPDIEESHPKNASGMSFLGVEIIDITIHKLPGLQFGCGKNKLPSFIDQKTVISPGGGGYSCFKFCLIASSHLRAQERKKMSTTFRKLLQNLHLTKYSKIVKNASKNFSLDGINSPATLSDFDTFVSNNPHIGLTVFESQDKKHLNTIFVSENFSEQMWKIRLFSFKSQKNKISHLCLIPNFSTFINSLSSLNGKKVARQVLCKFCEIKKSPKLNIIEEHQLVCERNPLRVKPESQLNFPSSEVPIRVMNSSVRSPPLLIAYCDFETYCRQNDDPSQCEKCLKLIIDCNCSFVINKGIFRALSYHLLILDGNSLDTVFEKYHVMESFSSKDAGVDLINTLWHLKYTLYNILSQNYKYDLSKLNLKKFNEMVKCEKCNRKFNSSDPGCRKTIHHNHFQSSDNIVNIICTRCNLNTNQFRRDTIPVYFFNGSRFDTKLILEPILRTWGCENVKSLDKNSENISQLTFFPFCVKDCLSFIQGSLDSNVQLLINSTDVNVSLQLLKNHNISKTYIFNGVSTICNHFPDQSQECENCIYNPHVFNLLVGKLAYPYEIISSPESLNIQTFPLHSEFYSSLKQTNVPSSQYENAKTLFGYCENFKHFHSIYNTLDTLLTSCVMNQFSNLIFNTLDGIYFDHYVSLAHLSYDACLRQNLKSDSDDCETVISQIPKSHENLYLIAEKNIRGGGNFFNSKFEISSDLKQILKGFLSPYQKKTLKKIGQFNTPPSWLFYFDATNLYGESLSQPLPVSNYREISDKKITSLNSSLSNFNQHFPEYNPSNVKNKGAFFIIDVPKLPLKYKNYPLLSQHYKPTLNDCSSLQIELYKKFYTKNYESVKSNQKLIFSMSKKKSYFAHYKIVSFLINEGINIKLKGGWTFNQSPIFAGYIKNLSDLRRDTESKLNKSLFKLLSNIIYGKSLQTARNRVNFSYIHASGDQEFNQQKIEGKNKISKCYFKSSRFLTSDIIQIRSVPRRVGTNHPLLIGATVLDLSKLKMLELFYHHIQPKFGTDQKLVYHDTDSFILKLEGEGVTKKLSELDIFDFNSFGENDPIREYISDELIQSSKGVVGKLKNELGSGQLMSTIVLQKKQYVNLVMNKGNDNKYFLTDNVTSKGLRVEKLNFRMYLECLVHHTTSSQLFNKISSKSGQLHFLKTKRKGLNTFDNSNYLHNCGICVSPINSSNTFLCDKSECEAKMIYLEVLLKNYDKIFNSKYKVINGKYFIINP